MIYIHGCTVLSSELNFEVILYDRVFSAMCLVFFTKGDASRNDTLFSLHPSFVYQVSIFG